MPLFRNDRLAALALIALTLFAYAPAMRGEFIWDDDDYVTANANLRTPHGLWNIWFVPRASPQYYPLVHTSFWIEYQVWGLRAPGYHVVNILLHAAAALLLWRLLVRLEIPAAWLAAALWAVHPVQVESVAWITERKNVLSALFYFGAAYEYVASATRQSGRTYAITLLLFIAALLSKTVTCSLPAALVLILWWKHGRVNARQWLSLLPMFVIGVAFATATVFLEREHVMAKGPEWDLGIADRILIAGRAVWFYLRTLVAPVGLSFIYPRWAIEPRELWQWSFPLGVIVALIVLFRMRTRWGRGPLVAALIFVGTLVPALGFFNIYPMRYSFVADHFQYHACVALLVLLAIGIHRLSRRWSYIVLVPLVLLTFWRSNILATSESLWLDTLAKNPDSWMVHLNLARLYAERGDDASAERHFEQQVTLAPHLPETHWNMGVFYARRRLFDSAMKHYDRALEVDPMFAPAWYARGRVFVQEEKYDAAAVQFARAIELARATNQRTYAAVAHAELAELLKRKRNFDKALEHYRAAVEADPAFARARVDYAALLAAMGRREEATRQFNEAVRFEPALEMYRSAVLRM